jgi:serine/threonine protein kinase
MNQHLPESMDKQHLLETGCSLESAEVLPEMIAGYKIVSMLGRGNFGTVFLALPPNSGRPVALKVAHPAWQASYLPDLVTREASVLSRLRHQHIVRFYESRSADGYWIISTEWIDGKDLRDLMLESRIPFHRSIEITLQLLDALGHAHKQGVVHRDVKPANVKLDQRGNVKLLDFGLAKLYRGLGPTFSQEGEVKGSLDYMSPEQAAGKVHEIDPRSDLYAVAVILYEMLTGHRPLPASTDDVSQDAGNQPFLAPQTLNFTIPDALNEVCLKALQANPGERFQSADEFAAALAAIELDSTLPDVLGPKPQGDQHELWERDTGPSNFKFFSTTFAYQCLMAVIALVLFFVAWKIMSRPVADPRRGSQAAELLVESLKKKPLAPKRKVQLTTVPTGAEMTLFLLDDVTGEPLPDQAYAAGQSPVTIDLHPGTYLIVADLGQDRFVEVNRLIPEGNTFSDDLWKHQSWIMHEDQVLLPEIRIPQFDATGMQRCGNFWLDKTPVSKAAFLSVLGREPLVDQQYGFVIGIDLDEAQAFCELLGKRIPTMPELKQGIAEDISHQGVSREWTMSRGSHRFGQNFNEPVFQIWQDELQEQVLFGRRSTSNRITFRGARSIEPLSRTWPHRFIEQSATDLAD